MRAGIVHIPTAIAVSKTRDAAATQEHTKAVVFFMLCVCLDSLFFFCLGT